MTEGRRLTLVRADGSPMDPELPGLAPGEDMTEEQVIKLLDFVENDLVQSEGVVEFSRMLRAWLYGSEG